MARSLSSFPNIGGSGPNYIFTETLGKPCIVIPHATHDQNNHAPNESMDLEGFFKGIRTGHCRHSKSGPSLIISCPVCA